MGRVPLPAVIAGVRSFLRRIGASEAVLFGSWAQGEELSNSDVDLIVISPRFAGQPFPQRLVFLQQHWTLPLFLEGLPYMPEELERLRHGRGVAARALEEGIRIHAGD